MNTPAFHELTPAEQERLAVLAEECSEVIQIVMKIWRHGYASTHPDNEDGPDNRDMLETELGHIEAAQTMMFKDDDIDPRKVTKSCEEKLKRIGVYLHHNS